MPRSLDPEFLREPPPASRALARLAVLAGLAIAASIGAALALFITGKFPSELNKMLGLSTDRTAVVSKVADDALKISEQANSPATRPPCVDGRATHRRGFERVRPFAVQANAPRPSAG